MLFLVFGILLFTFLAFRADKDDGSQVEQDVTELNPQTFKDEAVRHHQPEPYDEPRTIDEPLQPDTTVRYISDNTTTPVEGSHFVQVAALRTVADGQEALEDYAQKYAGYDVRIVLEEDGTGYPVKVLLGDFRTEADARRAAKRLGKPYKYINPDQAGAYASNSKRIY